MLKRLLSLFVLLLLLCGTLYAVWDDSLFSTAITGSTGDENMPFAISWTKSHYFNLLDSKKYGKARLLFTFSPIYSSVTDSGYDSATGLPSWLDGSVKDSYTYFLPGFSIEGSLSQTLRKWTMRGTLSMRYTKPMESGSGGVFYNNDGELRDRFKDKESIKAYPWLYGNRDVFVMSLSASASRYFDVKGFDEVYFSSTFEASPWFLFNFLGGNIESNYMRISSSIRESIVLKDEKQTTGLRWLRITASNTTSLSYTTGSVIPRHKLGSYRLPGSLSDSFSLTLDGPQFLSSANRTQAVFTLTDVTYFNLFGEIENSSVRSFPVISNDMYLSYSLRLDLMDVAYFSFNGTYYLYRGLSSLSGRNSYSGEVGFHFNI